MKNIRDHFDYIGWVPCISGHLLFEYTECGLTDKKRNIYAEINHVELDAKFNTPCRYIAVSSRVDWKDGNTKLYGIYRVVLLASNPINTDQLEGKVYIIPDNNPEWESRNIEEKLLNLKKLTISDQDMRKEFLNLRIILDECPQIGFVINFKLNRSGFTFLRHHNKNVKTTAETSFVVSRQAYYYIKYAFHKHAHHDKSAESLTTTFSLPGRDNAIGMILIQDLKRSLVQLKRDFTVSNYKLLLQSKGIVSYAKSLLVSCNKEGFILIKDYEAEKAYIENIGESLEVAAKKIESGIAVEEKVSANFRAIVLFALAIVAPISMVFRDDIHSAVGANKPSHLINLISSGAQSDSTILLLAGTILICYFLYRSIIIKYGSLPFAISGLHRLLESICFSKRRATVIILTLLALSALLLYTSLMGYNQS